MSDDSSSDLGRQGARGFFDVVSPVLLEKKFGEEGELVIMAEESSPRSLSGGSGQVSQVSGGGDDDVEDGEGSSSDLGGGVGLFGAFDGAEEHAGTGAELVDHARLRAGSSMLPLTKGDCQMFTQTQGAILGILNYQEDKVITHETDCVRLWDLASHRELLRFDVQVRRVQRYNHWLFCIDTDSDDIISIDMRDNEVTPNRYTGLEDDVTAIAVQNFSKVGVTLFAITRDSFAYSWKCADVDTHGATHEVLRTFRGHKQNVTSLDLGDSYLYTSSTDKTVRVWDYAKGTCVRVLTGHTDWVFSVKVIGERVFSGSRDGTVRVWSSKGDCLNIIQLGDIAYGVVLDGDYLYIRDANKRVVLCRSGGKNKMVGTAEGSTGMVQSLEIYKNVMITCALDDPALRIWSSSDGTLYAKLCGHRGPVNALALFNTGQVLTGGEDGAVRIWDLRQVFALYLKANVEMSAAVAALSPRKSSALGRRNTLMGRIRGHTSSLRESLKRPISLAMGVADVPEVTPQACAEFKRAMRAKGKTNKHKNAVYPESFTGKEALAWIKTHVKGLSRKQALLAYAQSLMDEGVFKVQNEASVGPKSICKLL